MIISCNINGVPRMIQISMRVKYLSGLNPLIEQKQIKSPSGMPPRSVKINIWSDFPKPAPRACITIANILYLISSNIPHFSPAVVTLGAKKCFSVLCYYSVGDAVLFRKLLHISGGVIRPHKLVESRGKVGAFPKTYAVLLVLLFVKCDGVT